MKRPYLRWHIALLSILAIIACIASADSSDGNLTAHFLDVGQGDSILIQFADKNILIDGGVQDMGPRVESDLRNNGVKEIDLLVATHPHEDHIGGLITILRDFPEKQVLDSAEPHTSQTYETFLSLIDQKNIPYTAAEQGQIINIDPAIKIEVLSPPSPHFVTDDLNQNSIVLKITYNKISFLLMGDAGLEAENSLLPSGTNLKSDILKVGHHGSNSASSSEFLAKVRPAISVIEVGKGNSYGHPTPKTLSALQNVGSAIYRTDLDGDITVVTNGITYSVTTQKASSTIGPSTQSPTSKSVASTVIASSGAQSSYVSSKVSQAATSSSGPFVGSSGSNKYHFPSCSAAKRIKPENEIWFSSSEDARNHGYVPCGICHPP